MKNKKMKILKIMPFASLMVASLSLPIVFKLNNTTNENKEINSLLKKNSKIFNDNISFNTCTLNDSNLEFKVDSPTSILSVPGGYFIPTNKGLILIDDKSLEIKWTCDSFSAKNNSIFSSLYIPETSREGSSKGSILVTVSTNRSGNIAVWLIDVETGEKYDEYTDLNLENYFDKGNDEDKKKVILNLQKVQGSDFQYALYPNGSMTNKNRNDKVTLFKLSANGFDKNETKNIQLFKDEGDNKISILSSGQIIINGNLYSIYVSYVIEDISNRSNFYIYVLDEKGNIKGQKQISDDFPNKNEDWITCEKSDSNYLNIKVNGDNVEFSSIINSTNNVEKNGGFGSDVYNISRILKGSFSLSELDNEISEINTNIFALDSYTQQDPNSNHMYEIKYAYYSSKMDKWISYCSSTSAAHEIGQVVIFDLNQINRIEDLDISSDKVNIFTNFSSPLFDNNNDLWIPIYSFDNLSTNIQNFIVFNGSDNELFKNKFLFVDSLIFTKNPFIIQDFVNSSSKPNIDDFIRQINSQWLFNKKDIIFKNPNLISFENLLTNVNAKKVDNDTIEISFTFNNNSFTFRILGFSDLKLIFKTSIDLTAEKLNISEKQAWDFVHNVPSDQDEQQYWNQWIYDKRELIFQNPEIIDDQNTITNSSFELINSNEKSVNVKFIFKNQNYSFIIKGFEETESLIIKIKDKNNFIDKTDIDSLKDKELNEIASLIDINFIFNNKLLLFENANLITDINQISDVKVKYDETNKLVNVIFKFKNHTNRFSIGYKAPAPAPIEAPKKSNQAKIIGGVLAIVGGILLLVIVGIIIYRKHKNSSNNGDNNNLNNTFERQNFQTGYNTMESNYYTNTQNFNQTNTQGYNTSYTQDFNYTNNQEFDETK